MAPQLAYAANIESKVRKKVFETNLKAADWLKSRSRSLDLYLSDKESSDISNKTTATVSTKSIWREQGHIQADIDFDLHLNLPNLEKQAKLKVSNVERDSDQRSAYKSQYQQQATAESYGAAIEFLRIVKDIRIKFEPRVSLGDVPVVTYLLQFKNNVSLKRDLLRYNLELFSHSNTSTGEFGSIEYIKSISKNNSVSLLFEEEYLNWKHKFSTLNAISLNQKVGDKSSMSYSFAVISKNRPVYHLASYSFGTSYNHMIYKNILHFNIGTSLNFNKVDSYKGVVAASLGFKYIL